MSFSMRRSVGVEQRSVHGVLGIREEPTYNVPIPESELDILGVERFQVGQ